MAIYLSLCPEDQLQMNAREQPRSGNVEAFASGLQGRFRFAQSPPPPPPVRESVVNLFAWPQALYLLRKIKGTLQTHIRSWWTNYSSWKSLLMYMLPVVTRTLAEHKTRVGSARKDKKSVIVCGHHLQNHALLGDCFASASPLHLLLSFLPEQVKLTQSRVPLNGQIDITEV